MDKKHKTWGQATPEEREAWIKKVMNREFTPEEEEMLARHKKEWIDQYVWEEGTIFPDEPHRDKE